VAFWYDLDMNGKHQPTLFMLVGLPATGKTTRAKEIESEYSALRFTPDEWIVFLYGENLDRPTRDAVRDPMELLQWQPAKRALEIGCNVVLDWGFWAKNQREAYRKEAENLGAKVKIEFLDASLDELWSRISTRPESSKGTLGITREELEQWSKVIEPPTPEELT